MSDQRTQAIRSATKRLDSFHSATYFSEAVGAALSGAGLSPRNQYFASRGAPLGAASAELVTATFYGFAPDFVASRVPACWEEADPAAVNAARLAGVEALSRDLFLGENADQLRDLAARVVDVLAPVIEAQDLSGRALYAGHRAVLTPGNVRAQDESLQVFVDLWAAITLLREYRGDGHLASLISGGLTGLEANILACATGATFTPSAMRSSRGFSEEQWRSTADSLVERGLMTESADSADLTEEGQELKSAVEDLTDDSVESAWRVLDDEALTALKDDSKEIAKCVMVSGVIPQKMFGHG